jgi:hypothetical protein
VVAEEADETILWLELLAIARPTFRQDQHARLAGEAEQLTAIFTASYATAKANLKRRAAARATRKSPNH